MSQIVPLLNSYPWALPVLVGVASLLLGLLIPRRGGASWLSGIIFFLPNLFLDFLDVVHTKKFKYYGLITALLAIEAFFAFRASTVYYDVLNTHMPLPEMVIVCVIVFIAVFLCGYMVATHGGTWNFWRVCTMIFVIFHDWAGTVWMNYSQPVTSTANAVASSTDQATNDGLKVVLTIGMCVLGLLPFIMGAWAEELRPQLEKELDEEVDTFTSQATRKIKRRAVERVLRMANHTNVVHLVRSLPANEFADFKQFVMPIIAPGTSHNLPDVQADEKYEARINDLTNEIAGLKMLLQPATGPNTDELEKIAQATAESKPETNEESNAQPVTETVDKTVSRKGPASASQRARRILKSHPDMRPADLAKRLEITPGYASQLKTKVLAESVQLATVEAGQA